MAEATRRGRPPKNATKEQMETISTYVNYIKSDAGANKVSQRIMTGMNDLKSLTRLLSDNGMYTPVLSEQFLQEMGFSSASSTTEELTSWLQHPDMYDINLRKLSHYLENSVAQYGRAVSLLSDIKTYNYDLRCATPNLSQKVGTDAFVRSRNKALDTLRKLNIPYQIRRIDRKTCEDGVAFVYFNRHKDGIDLFDLPTDYCYITAPWSYGYLFALDLTYFDRFAFSEMQVPELWTAYETFCKMRIQLADSDPNELVPYQYYMVSPFDGWCCVFDSTRPIKVPPMIGGALGALDSLGYRDLIKQKALIDLWRVLPLKIPIDEKSGKMLVSYKEASSIIDAIQAVLPENIITFASPFETANPVNADQTDVMSGLQAISNKGFYDYSAMPNALFNTDMKSGAALKLATQTLFAYASSGIYASMQNLVNWILRVECGSQFDWHIVFHGNKMYEEEEKEKAVKLFQAGNFPVSYVMSHFGFEPFDIENAFIMDNAIGIKDIMKPIPMFQMQQAGPGAPEKADSEKSEASDVVDDAGL